MPMLMDKAARPSTGEDEDSDRRPRVTVFCLTYGEPPENEWRPQYEYSLSILNRLTRRVAPIPKFVTPSLAARRGLIRARKFEELQWNSPLERISQEQVQGLQEWLDELRPDVQWDVRLVCEFRPPLLPEYLKDLEEEPPTQIVILPLYVQESDFTTGISRTDLEQYHELQTGRNPLPAPRYVEGLGFEERCGKAMADHVWRYCREHGWDESVTKDAALILGSHGTIVYPEPGINNGATETCHLFGLIRKHLKDKFKTVRIGWLNHSLGGKWTDPAVLETGRQVYEQGIRRVVYFPFGFVGDNGESMIEGKEQLAPYQWEDLLYLPCVNSNPDFLKVLAELVIERAEGPEATWEGIGRGNPRFERIERPAILGEKTWYSFGARTLALFAALFWTAIGAMLTIRGVLYGLRLDGLGALALAVLVGLFIGWFKGTRVLSKLAIKNLVRLRRLPQPSPIWKMFSKASWIVILFFTTVGMGLRFTPMPDGVRAAILMGVGLAMLVGVGTYIRYSELATPLRQAMRVRKNKRGIPLLSPVPPRASKGQPDCSSMKRMAV